MRKATNRTEDSPVLSDQEILEPVWVGKKTGNFFKAVEVVLEEGTKHITYQGHVGGTYKKPFDVFISRFREATEDDLWKQIKNTATAEDSEAAADAILTVVEPDHRHDLDRMILYPDCRDEIRIGLNRITRQVEMEKAWSLSKIEPKANRCVLNFFGKPGTGKTLGAVAVAKILEKKLMKVDYAQVISKFVGDTAKHIKQAFKIAKDNNAALMFDEADSLLSARLSFGDSADGAAVTSINQNRNVLLNEIDSFNGVVIMCTNFFSNYDEAFLRRIARHVEFKIPNTEMRLALFKLHLPNMEKVSLDAADWDKVANSSTGFSGGDICNAVVNALTRASMPERAEDWELDVHDILAEIELINSAKRLHKND